MRNLYLALFILWSLGAWYYYVYHIRHVNGGANSTTTTIPNLSTDQALLFRWSSFNIPLDSNFPSLKESILATKETDNVLEITGYYFPDESNDATQYELGIARASEVKKLLLEHVPEERIRVFSTMLSADDVPQDSLIKGIQFEWVAAETEEEEEPAYADNEASATDEIEPDVATSTSLPKEIPSSSSDVYAGNSFIKPFPPNRNSFPEDLVTFLDDLATRLIAENEKVIIRGHTDSEGDKEINFSIGLRRAKKIRDHLLNKGVNRKQIETTSDGEDNPIADNNTEEGRQLNRRIEILIK